IFAMYGAEQGKTKDIFAMRGTEQCRTKHIFAMRKNVQSRTNQRIFSARGEGWGGELTLLDQ
ncbi:MAG: hypothetical protein RR996_06610, partial [Alistipes sp.]